MENQDFTTTLLVDQSPEVALNAVLNLRGWWSEQIDGPTDKINEECVYHYKDIHYCKLKLVELVPNKRAVWLVLDNFFSFTEDKTEWIGTKLVFDISEKGNQTEVRVMHEGLVPAYECFEICKEAWTNFANNSLYKLITTGKGEPSSKEEDGFNQHMVEKWKLGQ